MSLIKKYNKYLALTLLSATLMFPSPSSQSIAADLGDDYVGTGVAPMPDVDYSDDAAGGQDATHSNDLVSVAEFNLFYALNEQMAAAIRTLQASPSKIAGIDYGPTVMYTDAQTPEYITLERFMKEDYSPNPKGFFSQLEGAVLKLKELNANIQSIPMLPGTGMDYRDKVLALMDKIYEVNTRADLAAPPPPIKYKNILLDDGATKKVILQQYDRYEVPTLLWETEFQPEFYTVEINMSNAAGNFMPAFQGDEVATNTPTAEDEPIIIRYVVTDTTTGRTNTLTLEVHILAAAARSRSSSRVAPSVDNQIPIYLSKVQGVDIPADTYWVNAEVYDGLYAEIQKAVDAVQHIHPNAFEALKTLTETINPDTGQVYKTDEEVAYLPPLLHDNGTYSTPEDLDAIMTSLTQAYELYISSAQLGTNALDESRIEGNFEIMIAKAMIGLKDFIGPLPELLPDTNEFAGLVEDPRANEADSLFHKSGAVYVYLDDAGVICPKDVATNIRLYKPPKYKEEGGQFVVEIPYDGPFDELDANTFFVSPAIAISEQDLGQWQPGGDTQATLVTQMFATMEIASAHIAELTEEINDFYALDGEDNERNKLASSHYDKEVTGAIIPSIEAAIQAIRDRLLAYENDLKPGTRHEQLAMLTTLQKLVIHLGLATADGNNEFMPLMDYDHSVGDMTDDVLFQPASFVKVPMLAPGNNGTLVPDKNFDIADHSDTTLSILASQFVRTFYSVSTIMGTNISGTFKWVTPEEHNELYALAVEALTVTASVEFIPPIGENLPNFPYIKNEAGNAYILNPDLATKIYTATEMSDLITKIQSAINAYQDNAETGLRELLNNSINVLNAQINDGTDIMTPSVTEVIPATDPESRFEFVTQFTPRSLNVNNLVISDEGLYKITTERKLPVPDVTTTPNISEAIIGIDQIKTAMDVTEMSDAEWVLPADLDALDLVLTDALSKADLLTMIISPTTISSYEDENGNNKPGIDEIVYEFYHDGEVFTKLATELGTSINTFNDAKKESLAEEYDTGQKRFQAAIDGTATNPQSARAVLVGDTYKAIGQKDSDIYLAEDNPDHPNTAPEDRTLVFSEDGYRYIRYYFDEREWSDLSLIPNNMGIKWVNKLDVVAYDRAIDKLEDNLKLTVPKTFPTPDDSLVEFEEAVFDPTFLYNFTLEPVTYFDTAINTLDLATDVFFDARKDPVRPDNNAFNEAYLAFIGGTTTYTNGVADLKANNVRMIKDANNNFTGQYTSTQIHISNNGLTGIDGILLNDDDIINPDGRGKYLAKGNFDPLNLALEIIDDFIARDIDVHIEGFELNPDYFTEQLTILQDAIDAFDEIRTNATTVLDAYLDPFNEALDEIYDKINADLINQKIVEVNADVDGIDGLHDLISIIYGPDDEILEVRLDTSRVLLSHDGLRPGIFDTGTTTAEHWTTKLLFTNIEFAIEGIDKIVKDARLGALNHINGFLEAQVDGAKNMYFQNLPSVILLDAAVEDFEIVPADKSFELNDMLRDAIEAAKRIIGYKEYVDDEGNTIPAIPPKYPKSNLLGIDFITFDMLNNGDSDNNGYDDIELSQLPEKEYIDGSQIFSFENAINVAQVANNDVAKQVALDKLLKLLDEFEPRVLNAATYKENIKVRLYNQYRIMEMLLIDEDGDRVLVSDSNGLNIPEDRMYVNNAIMTAMLNTIDYNHMLIDKIYGANLAQLQTQYVQNEEMIEKYVPLPGQANEEEYAAFEEAKANLRAAINNASNIIAIKPIDEEGLIDIHAALDTENAVVYSNVHGTELSGQDENEDGIPDTGQKWVYKATFVLFEESIKNAILEYNSASSTVQTLEKALDKIIREIEFFEQTIEYGTKEIYTDLTTKMQHYIDNANNGTSTYLDNTTVEEMEPIPAFAELLESIQGGIDIEPTKQWSTAIDKEKLRNAVGYGQLMLDINMNMADGVIKYSLEQLIAEYNKVEIAYQYFYARDLDGKLIPDKQAKVFYGSKGFADSTIRQNIADAIALVNDLVYLDGATPPTLMYTTYDGVPLNPYGNDSLKADGVTPKISTELGNGNGNGNGIDEESSRDIRVSNRNGIDVLPNTIWISIKEVIALTNAINATQITLDNFDNAKTNKITLDNAQANLLRAVDKFNSSSQEKEAGTGDTQYQVNYAKLEQAIEEALTFIGKDPETGLFDYDSIGMDWTGSTILINVPTNIQLILGSITGKGDDIVNDPNKFWVPLGNYKAYENSIALAQKALALPTSNENSINSAIATLQRSTDALVKLASTLVNGQEKHGRNDKLEEAKTLLSDTIDAAELLMDNLVSSLNGKDVSPSVKWVTIGYYNTLKSRISSAKIALANSYGNFATNESGDIIYDENGFKVSLGTDTTTIETIALQLRYLDDRIDTSEFNSSYRVPALGKEIGIIPVIERLQKPGLAETDQVNAADAKKTLKAKIDEATTLSLTKVSSKEGTDIPTSNNWITNLAFMRDPRHEDYADPNYYGKAVPAITYLKNAIFVANSIYNKTSIDPTTNEKIYLVDASEYSAAETLLARQMSEFEVLFTNALPNATELVSVHPVDPSIAYIGGAGTKENVLSAKQIVNEKISEANKLISTTSKILNAYWVGSPPANDPGGNYGYEGDIEDNYSKKYVLDGTYYAHERVVDDLKLAITEATSGVRRSDITVDELTDATGSIIYTGPTVLENLENAIIRFEAERKLKGAYENESTPKDKAIVFLDKLLTPVDSLYPTIIPNSVIVEDDEMATIEQIEEYIAKLINIAVKDINVTVSDGNYLAPGDTVGPAISNKGSYGRYTDFTVSFSDEDRTTGSDGVTKLGVFVEALDWFNELQYSVEDAVKLIKDNKTEYVLPSTFDHDDNPITEHIEITEQQCIIFMEAILNQLLVDNGFIDFSIEVKSVPRTYVSPEDGTLSDPDGSKGNFAFTAIVRKEAPVLMKDTVVEDTSTSYGIETARIDVVIEPIILPNEYDTNALLAAKNVLMTFDNVPAEGNSEFGAKSDISKQIAVLLNRPETEGVTFEVITTEFIAAQRPSTANGNTSVNGTYKFIIKLFRGYHKEQTDEFNVAIIAPELDLAQDDLDALKILLENPDPAFYTLTTANSDTEENATAYIQSIIQDYLAGQPIQNALETIVNVKSILFVATTEEENGRIKFQVEVISKFAGQEPDRTINTQTIEVAITQAVARNIERFPEISFMPMLEFEEEPNYYLDSHYENSHYEDPDIVLSALDFNAEELEVPADDFYDEELQLPADDFYSEEFLYYDEDSYYDESSDLTEDYGYDLAYDFEEEYYSDADIFETYEEFLEEEFLEEEFLE